MGIVLKQSFTNTLILFLGFAIGGINVLFIYTHFLHEDYYGLNTFLLSTANILSPLMVLGMQHTIIKFFTSFQTKYEQDQFLTSALVMPLFIIIPLGFIGAYTYESIANWLSVENAIIKPYTYLIFLTAIFIGYFEVFYSFSKVQYQSVFGNFVKEMFARISATFLLFAVHFKWITEEQFIYAIAIVYALRMVIMMIYAFTLYKPDFIFKFPKNSREILSYSFYIILAGSASGILLDIDKFMIPQLEQIAEVAYYAVGIYIASVIAIPSRAMQQIINPLTAKELNNNNLEEVLSLYKKSSITLLVAGGLLFLLINLNIQDLYALINKPEYAVGGMIVLMISISEMYKLALGTNGAILTNSDHYRVFFYFSIAMALSVIFLNKWLIVILGIDGAALATLIVVLVFSTIKIIYIQVKMNMQPFTNKTIVILIVILVLFFAFYFIDLPFHAMVNMIIKSITVTVIYTLTVYKFRISEDVNGLINKYIQR
ncbi:polysaccharide biosynthesis C-terminal domain-containing protein [Aureibaculum sp. A20]|uniref:Polysaccharide biosynthesis C-terminal domain-containing protein n=1 Tax=Aureibaculum flavum TaxID=2795986 RepID=A0ABS0WWW2_9FLAO|nr:polysaccharide biosynthesis C-terminal domain-containing protein [Aureibaculum flavum]MBJ2176438.1 polysaccharide biosynthesis C-terminal domain-containing protein [Aureibaculum flavum]